MSPAAMRRPWAENTPLRWNWCRCFLIFYFLVGPWNGTWAFVSRTVVFPFSSSSSSTTLSSSQWPIGRPRWTSLSSSQSSKDFSDTTTTTNNPTIPYPPGSTLTLTEPMTGCEVVLVGCFHGAPSSAADVEACLPHAHDVNTVVVLELCATRFADLRRDMERQERSTTSPPAATTPNPLARFARSIRHTIASRGLSTGVAAALLGGVAGLQTSLSGLQPGLEFRTAVAHVRESNNNGDIILADQPVEETLDKVGRLWSRSVALWKKCFQQGWGASFGREATALARAVGLPGSSSSNNNNNNNNNDASFEPLNLWSFGTRSPDAIRDVLRLIVPPVLLLQCFVTVVHAVASGWGDDGLPPKNYLGDDPQALTASLVVFVVNALLLGVGYLSVALPAVQVILRERDTCLTTGIRAACRLASSSGDKPGRVVAVLGLLHVNGIAQQLLRPEEGQE